MHATFYGKNIDAELNNLLTTIEAVQSKIVFSPACDPGITDHDTFFIALHALAQNVQNVLKLAEFSDR